MILLARLPTAVAQQLKHLPQELRQLPREFVATSTNYLETYSYFGVFIWLVLGSLWLPLPEEVALLFAGFLAKGSYLKLSWAITVCLAGVLVGDNLGFWLSRRYGNALIDRLRLRDTKPRLWFERQFHRHAGRTVFLSRFAIGIRAIGPWLAGVHHMPWIDFQFYNFLGVIIWIPLIVFLGFVFGDGTAWATDADNLERLAAWAFGIFLLLFIGKGVYHRVVGRWRAVDKQ